MNSDPKNLHALLDDVLPASGERCCPSSAKVLSMLHSERQRRRLGQASAVLLALIATAAGALLCKNRPTLLTTIVQAPVEPQRILIHSVNDEELFALLQGVPTALVKLPNGYTKLLVIDEPVAKP